MEDKYERGGKEAFNFVGAKGDNNSSVSFKLELNIQNQLKVYRLMLKERDQTILALENRLQKRAINRNKRARSNLRVNSDDFSLSPDRVL